MLAEEQPQGDEGQVPQAEEGGGQAAAAAAAGAEAFAEGLNPGQREGMPLAEMMMAGGDGGGNGEVLLEEEDWMKDDKEWGF